MSIIRDFTLYLHAGISVPPVVHVNQYDQGEVWRFTLLEEDGSKYTPSTGALIGVKSDGHAIAGVTGTVLGDGRVSITETQQMTAAAGKAVFELTIDGGSHGTANFIVQVEPKPTDGAILSDSDLSIIQEGIDQAERIAQYGSPLVATSSSQMTNHQSVYVYTGTTTTSLTNGHWYYWNGSAWADGGVYNSVAVTTDKTLTQVNVAADAKATGDAVSELKTALNGITGNTYITFTSGGYIQCNLGTADINSPNTNASYRYAVVPCSEGDLFVVSAKGASAGRAWAFVNSSGTVLSVADANATVSDLELTAPQNSAYLIINDNNTGVLSYYAPLIKDTVQSLDESMREIVGTYSDTNLWDLGTISIVDGTESNSISRLRTKNFISENITDIFTDSESIYVFYVLAWTKNGSYVGGWNGTTFGKDASYVNLIHDLDIKELSNAYPNYTFRLIARKTTNANITVSESTAYKFEYKNYVGYDDLNSMASNMKYSKSYGVGLCWDWWLKSNACDTWGNEYVGFVDENANVGIMKRNADGSTEYKTLGKSYNDDDHNGLAVLLLPDGRILCIGAGGHGVDNRVLVYRSKNPYSISDFDDFSFAITDRNNYRYRLTYSQPFYYNGKVYNFMRCHTLLNSADDATGYICVISSDNGETWAEYTAFVNYDAYITFSEVSDVDGLLRYVAGNNPATYGDTKFCGGFVNLATEKITDLADVEIGEFATLTGSVDVPSAATYANMTVLANQRDGSKLGRLFTAAVTLKESTVFLMAHSDDATATDFTYELYNDGTVIPLGKSGVPFGNNHYTSGVCFGCSENQMYYSKAITEKADGAHELHRVLIANNAVESDEIVHTSAMCMIRPLYCGNGDILVNVGHYNDQNTDGTYNSSFVSWNLSPLFVS